MSCLLFTINIYDEPEGGIHLPNFPTWRSLSRQTELSSSLEDLYQAKRRARCLIAMWIVRDIQNYASCLNFTGWDLLWRGRDARIFPSRRTSSNVRHDDKSSARTTSGTTSRCGHPSETQSFPISRATGLKNVARKRAAEKRWVKRRRRQGERRECGYVNYCRDAAMWV